MNVVCSGVFLDACLGATLSSVLLNGGWERLLLYDRSPLWAVMNIIKEAILPDGAMNIIPMVLSIMVGAWGRGLHFIINAPSQMGAVCTCYATLGRHSNSAAERVYERSATSVPPLPFPPHG